MSRQREQTAAGARGAEPGATRRALGYPADRPDKDLAEDGQRGCRMIRKREVAIAARATRLLGRQ